MIKTKRVSYRNDYMLHGEKGLQDTLNEIVSGEGKILFVTSDSYGGGQVGYTIIYEEKE